MSICFSIRDFLPVSYTHLSEHHINRKSIIQLPKHNIQITPAGYDFLVSVHLLTDYSITGKVGECAAYITVLLLLICDVISEKILIKNKGEDNSADCQDSYSHS